MTTSDLDNAVDGMLAASQVEIVRVGLAIYG